MHKKALPDPESGNNLSATRALRRGILAGLGIALSGMVAGFLMPRGVGSLLLPFLGALLSGAVAAWVTSFHLGSSPGGASAIAFLALLLLAFISFLLEYGMLLNLAMSPYIAGMEAPEAVKEGLEVSLLKFSFLISLLNIPLGAVFGLLFGRPRPSPKA